MPYSEVLVFIHLLVDGTDQAENKIENSDFKLIRKDVIERFKKIIDQTSAS